MTIEPLLPGKSRHTSRSIFERMPLDELTTSARAYTSRSAFLASLGFKKRHCLGLEKRMAREGLSVSDLWPTSHAKKEKICALGHKLDLTDPVHSYFFGLALADGTLRSSDRGRGSLVIELRSSDGEVLDQLSRDLPWSSSILKRDRKSPFDGSLVQTSRIVICSYDLRFQLIACGFPVGAKSKTCAPPSCVYDERAFWRGFIDGDGSIGVTADGTAFISLVTVSEAMATAFLDMIERVTGFRPKSSKNIRDGAWNVMVTRGRAIQLTEFLYGGIADDHPSMTRKRQKALSLITSKD